MGGVRNDSKNPAATKAVKLHSEKQVICGNFMAYSMENIGLNIRKRERWLIKYLGGRVNLIEQREVLMSKYKSQRGFTLLELMVVVVIIGVLGALIIPNFMDRPNEARVTAAKTDISSVMQALKLYKLDNHRYPTAEQGLGALIARPASGPAPANWKAYMDKLPNDPWGHPYQYLNPGVKGEVDVLSFGADGQSGGEGFDADIGSWQ